MRSRALRTHRPTTRRRVLSSWGCLLCGGTPGRSIGAKCRRSNAVRRAEQSRLPPRCARQRKNRGMTDPDSNLFTALRAGFAADLDATAIETIGDTPLFYTWRDIERATAMFANLLDSLDLPAGARIAVQAEKSVESLLFYLAVLRAGFVYLPLNTAYRSDELAYFVGNATPGVLVCAPKDFPWLSKLAFAAG